MDTTEKILKLVALGWNGKEPELDFFQRVFGIRVEIILKDGGMTETILSFKNQGKQAEHYIKVKKKKVDPVRYCLRLFRTDNGEIIGPNSGFFIGADNQEWT